MTVVQKEEGNERMVQITVSDEEARKEEEMVVQIVVVEKE